MQDKVIGESVMEAYELNAAQLTFWLHRLNNKRQVIRGMGRLMGWYELAVDPLMNEKSLAEPAPLFSRLRWLRDQVNIWLPGWDERQAAECHLCFIELSLLNPDNTDLARLEELLEVIDTCPCGEQSAMMQAYSRIVLAGLHGSDSRFGLTHKRYESLLEQVPAGRNSPEMWFGAALWAYENRHEDVLEQALEFCVISYPGCVDEYIWRMCNLMYRLQSRKAIARDVEKLIHSCTQATQLLHFRECLLEDCQRSGLMDRELQYWLERREKDLLAEPLSLVDDRRVAG